MSTLLCILDCTGRLSLLAGMYIFWKIITCVPSVSTELSEGNWPPVSVQWPQTTSSVPFAQTWLLPSAIILRSMVIFQIWCYVTRNPAFTLALQSLLFTWMHHQDNGVATKSPQKNNLFSFGWVCQAWAVVQRPSDTWEPTVAMLLLRALPHKK